MQFLLSCINFIGQTVKIKKSVQDLYLALQPYLFCFTQVVLSESTFLPSNVLVYNSICEKFMSQSQLDRYGCYFRIVLLQNTNKLLLEHD